MPAVAYTISAHCKSDGSGELTNWFSNAEVSLYQQESIISTSSIRHVPVNCLRNEKHPLSSRRHKPANFDLKASKMLISKYKTVSKIVSMQLTLKLHIYKSVGWFCLS